MYLVQALLPLYDANRNPFPKAAYDDIRDELTAAFGGLTAYVRSPAAGLWKEGGGETVRDDIVIYEVMVERLDRAWWKGFRERVRARFAQDDLVVRAHRIERL